MKATIISMLAINPDPVVTFEKVGVFRVSPNRYVPGVTARSGNPSAPQMVLPLLVADVKSEEELDKVYAQLKENLELGFSEYKERWRKSQGQVSALDSAEPAEA